MTPLRLSPRPRLAGLSLVELMVALAISLFLLAGMTYVYTGTKQTSRTDQALSRIQENLRFALEYLTFDLRMAGYMGCASGTIASAPRNCTTGYAPSTLMNVINSPTYNFNFGQPLQGYEGGASSWSPALDAGYFPGAITGTDVVTVRGAYGAGTRVRQHPGGSPPGSADIKVTEDSGIKEFEVLIVTDCVDAAVFQATNVSKAGGFDNLVHNQGVGSPGNECKQLGKEYTGAEVFRISTRSYYIRNGANGRPALWRIENSVASELVEGIDSLQVRYGVDDNADDIVDRYENAQKVETDGVWSQVISARIELLASSSEDSIVTEPQKVSFNGGTLTPTDRRLRVAATATVGIRNRLRP